MQSSGATLGRATRETQEGRRQEGSGRRARGNGMTEGRPVTETRERFLAELRRMNAETEQRIADFRAQIREDSGRRLGAAGWWRRDLPAVLVGAALMAAGMTIGAMLMKLPRW
ncbi:MAG TPA: hypothetical protein VHY76_02875 [Acetobacteraceae bacterium]|nr:hypothetical protein [Acetobacteraceae bacterium]